MLDLTTASSLNRNNSNAAKDAGSDAGVTPRCSATAQQCLVEGAWVGRADPSKHLVELCEHLSLTNSLQRQLIEEVIITLKQVNSGSQQLESNPAPAEEFHQRISYGTDHLRAGAGACELVCSQAMLFELGCLLLNHARSCQQKEEPAS
jgi:hypothetical protein